MDQQRRHDEDGREKATGTGAIALLDILRQRGDPAPEVKRRKDHSQKYQTERRHPFEVPDHQTVLIAGRCQAHKMNGGNIGAE